MSKRGAELREHILYAAKNVFLEVGFERASMDLISERAKTSKRTLYAHFDSKEKLYLAILELVREIYLSKLQSPDFYSTDASEALVLFCGRYLESLQFVWTTRMSRMCLAEADRFPEGAAAYYDVLFSAPSERLSHYLSGTFGLSETAGEACAHKLLSNVIYPKYTRCLFGVDRTSEEIPDGGIATDFNLEPIRLAVAELLNTLKLPNGIISTN